MRHLNVRAVVSSYELRVEIISWNWPVASDLHARSIRVGSLVMPSGWSGIHWDRDHTPGSWRVSWWICISLRQPQVHSQGLFVSPPPPTIDDETLFAYRKPTFRCGVISLMPLLPHIYVLHRLASQNSSQRFHIQRLALSWPLKSYSNPLDLLDLPRQRTIIPVNHPSMLHGNVANTA